MDTNPHGKARSKRSTILDPKLNILYTLMLGDSSTPTVRSAAQKGEGPGPCKTRPFRGSPFLNFSFSFFFFIFIVF